MDVDFIRSQFQDGHYGVITKNGFSIGVRHLQMLYMFANSIAIGIIRGSMGIAVLAINDQTRKDDTYIKIYNWDGKIQGAILSSFFIGYALMLVPSEKILRNISAKFLTTAILFINGALCVAMPTIVNRGGWIAVCNAKLLMGMSHACFHTVNHVQLETWLPPNEKTIFSTLIYSGVQLGIITALPLAGLISAAALGWELVYYALSMMGLSMAVISGTLTASSPEDHPAVGDTEKEFIRKNLECYRKKDLPIPWHAILTSSKLWALIFAHAASSTLFIFYVAYLPAYIMTFGLSLKESSWYCMWPFLTMSITYIILRPTTEWIFGLKYLNYICSTQLFRKTINTIGAFGIVMGLTTVQNFPSQWNWATIIVLAAILGLLGMQFCGFLISFQDLSENFSGTLIMLSCTFSSVFSGCMPYIFGLILGDNMNSTERWRIILLILASLYIVFNIIYTVFGSHDRQYWDHVSNKRHIGHLNMLMDTAEEQLDKNGQAAYVSHKNEMDTSV
ncbi:unnamed protein product [Arctia plantaginis]|uniref:Major facilitator superfamily (MFS) profile domain-containing protein n=1 Tax=Arctia plantaginis TaxID=874455 RepID=A0A8S0YQ05_ARCPL|nr:unnamed protein product [Arctia plantaginis]